MKYDETFSNLLRQPIPSIYGIFTYIWEIFMVNVDKYTSPMDGMGRYFMVFSYLHFIELMSDVNGVSWFP